MNNEQASVFFLKYRRPVLSALAILAAGVVGAVAFLVVRDVSTKKAVAGLEELVALYAELDADGGDEAAAAKARDMREKLAGFGAKTRGYAGARAWAMAGDLDWERKAWGDAEESYRNAARRGEKTHLAPVAWFNAAFCAEEQGNNEDARAYWGKSLSYDGFPHAAHAQFSIARVWEKTGNVEEALAAYRLVAENYEKETGWTSLARSRIIVLEAEASGAP